MTKVQINSGALKFEEVDKLWHTSKRVNPELRSLAGVLPDQRARIVQLAKDTYAIQWVDTYVMRILRAEEGTIWLYDLRDIYAGTALAALINSYGPLKVRVVYGKWVGCDVDFNILKQLTNMVNVGVSSAGKIV